MASKTESTNRYSSQLKPALTLTPTFTPTLTSTPTATATATPPFAPFVVLGKEGVWLKEGVVVHSGDVGANTASAGPFLSDCAEVVIGEKVRFVDPASRLFGDSMLIRQKAQVYDVYYNELTNRGLISGTQHTPLALPVVSALPPVPTFTPGTQNFDVPQNGALTLTAGDYGELRVRSKAVITFTGGVYTFSAWDIGEDVKLYFTAATEIRIAGRLDTDAKTYVGPAPNTTGLTAAEITFIVTGQNGHNGNINAGPKAAEFGERNVVVANVYAPNGTVWLRERTVATGAFIGKWVVIGGKVELTLMSGH